MQLGSAFASPHLFPLDKLAKGLTPQMKSLAPAQLTGHLTVGDEKLRRQIALRYGTSGHHVDPAELVITNGAMEALNLSLQTVTQPGMWWWWSPPAFHAALQVLERLKLRAVEVATHPRTGWIWIPWPRCCACMTSRPAGSCPISKIHWAA